MLHSRNVVALETFNQSHCPRLVGWYLFLVVWHHPNRLFPSLSFPHLPGVMLLPSQGATPLPVTPPFLLFFLFFFLPFSSRLRLHKRLSITIGWHGLIAVRGQTDFVAMAQLEETKAPAAQNPLIGGLTIRCLKNSG